MAGISSTSALFKLAVQSAKGTPATALLCGMMEQHGANVAFDLFDDTPEHGCRPGVTSDRATVKKSASRRAGYIVRGTFRQAMYPRLLGVALRGAGFDVATTPTLTNEVQTITITGTPTGGTFTVSFDGYTTSALAYNIASADLQTALRALTSVGGANLTVSGSAGGPYTVTFNGTLAATNVNAMTASGAGLTGGTSPAVAVAVTTPGGSRYAHVFTLSDRADVAWLTALTEIGARERRVTDVRVSRLTFEAGTQGIRANGTFAGITEDNAAGSETHTEETLVELLPSEGSLTIKYDPDGANTTIFSSASDTLNRLTLDIANAVDEQDTSLFRFTRAGLEQQGVDVTGRVEGIDVDYDTYDMMIRGGTGGADPHPEPGIFSLTWTWQSAILIDATPYSMAVSIPYAEMTLDDFSAEGSNVIRWNSAYRMIDLSGEPITITLTNDYAGTVY